MGDSLVRNITLIGPGAGLDAQISNMTTVNNGLITGGLNAMVNGGVPPYSYVWKKDGSVLMNTWSYLSVSQTGTYSLVVTDATSGMDSATVVVSLPEDTTTQAPAPPAWGMYGNAGNGDILEGEGTPWLGTADSTDVVMKANGVPQLRLGANGVTEVMGRLKIGGLGNVNPCEILTRGSDGTITTTIGPCPPPAECVSPVTPWSIAPDGNPQNIALCNSYKKVGIGYINPQYELHVAGTGYFGQRVLIGVSSPLPAIDLQVEGTAHLGKLRVNTETGSAEFTVKGGSSQSGQALEVQDSQGNGALKVSNDGKVIVGGFQQTEDEARLYLGDEHHYISSKHNHGLSFSTFEVEDAMMIEEESGKVNIGGKYSGTSAELSNYKLSVNGIVLGKEFYVTADPWDNDPWPDFVFKKDYELRPLDDLQRFISEEGHLPEIPTAQEVETQGVGMARMSTLLLKKVEELTLYMLQMDKRMKQLEEENTQLKNKNEALKISGK